MADFLRSLIEFQRRFPDERACAAYLAAARWPDGFRCPGCGHDKGWELSSKPFTWECSSCGRQTSVTAGTVMHGSKLALTVWFWAAYLMATHSNGISALQLVRQLGLGSYKTAWLLCAKLRRAMGALAAVLIISALVVPAVGERVEAFADKGSAGKEVTEAFQHSRGWLIDLQWQSFLARPWTGRGFQVYPSGVFPTGVTELMGIPVSASVEKSFIGTAVFVGLLLGLLRAAMATGDPRAVCLILACLFVNLGECVLFAMGGLGLYVWLLIDMAVTGAAGRERHAA